MKQIKYTQNFLKDANLVKKLVQNASIEKNDTVIEIGSGKGIITKCLADKVGHSGKVIALEIDDKLFETLKTNLTSLVWVKLINIDARNYDWGKEKYKVFSNVPFMFTSDLMNILTNVSIGPEIGYVILQKESALMYGGSDLDSRISVKSLLASPYYSFSIVHSFLKSDFTPTPNVDSVLLKLEKRENPLVTLKNYDLYKDFIAFISQDRVGEGKWKKIFSKSDLSILTNKGLILGKGIKSQDLTAIISSFNYASKYNSNKLKFIEGSMKKLYSQQSVIIKQNRTRKATNWKNT